MLIPVIGCLNLHYGIGGEIKGLTLGVVNDEVNSMNECFNKSLITYDLMPDSTCILHKTSCRFIHELLDDNLTEIVSEFFAPSCSIHYLFILQKYYENYDEASLDARRGDLMGFIQFASNYTESLLLFSNDQILDDKGKDKFFTDSGNIQITLDKTDLQKTSQIELKIFRAYQSFMEGLMVACDLSKKAGNIPIVYEEFFGKVDFDYRLTIVPGIVLL